MKTIKRSDLRDLLCEVLSKANREIRNDRERKNQVPDIDVDRVDYLITELERAGLELVRVDR